MIKRIVHRRVRKAYSIKFALHQNDPTEYSRAWIEALEWVMGVVGMPVPEPKGCGRAGCSKMLVGRTDKRYCSDACRVMAHRERKHGE